MKKPSLRGMILAILIGVFSGVALAQPQATPPGMEKRREMMEQKKERTKKRMERKKGRMEKRLERKEGRMKNRLEHKEERMEQRLEKKEQRIRIEEQIEKK